MSENAEKIENPQSIPDGNSQLAAIVKESEQNLAEEKLKKSGAGRKRGPNFENSYYARKRYGTGPKAAPASEPAPAAAAEPAEAPVNIEEELVMPLMLISRVPAMRAGIAELALDEEEAKAAAHSLQRLLDAYAPDASKMDPKTAAVLGAAMTFGTLTLNKLMIYSVKKQEIIEMQRKMDAENATSANEQKVVHFEPTPQQVQQSAFPAAQ